MLTENSILEWYDKEVLFYNKANDDINQIYRELGHVKAIQEGLAQNVVERSGIRKVSKAESESALKAELARILNFREDCKNTIINLRRVLQRPSLRFEADGTIKD